MNSSVLAWSERSSKSNFIASVWTCNPREITPRTVLADPCTSIILVKSNERAKVVLRGPETKPRNEHYMPDTTWIGIRLYPGVKLKNFRAQQYLDCSRPIKTDYNGNFLFEGVLLHFPEFDAAETLIEQMLEHGLLSGKAVNLRGTSNKSLSIKAYSRYIKQNTGLSPYKLHQLQRMLKVFKQIQKGVPLVTIASEEGFADQAHLHRAVRQYLGHTPKELLRWPQKP
jgi:AraC-like DNA-binding protein